MSKKISLMVSFVMVLSLIFTSPFFVTAEELTATSGITENAANNILEAAANYTAAIDISTTNLPKEIPLGMSGPHNELGGSVYRWDNPELINRVNDYEGFGYVRINGTNLNAYDWKTGTYGEEALGQLQSDEKSYYGYTGSGRVIEAKSGETLEDLRVFLQQTSSQVIIPVNVFTNSVEQIGDMAKYCYENHIPVIYFELGNEVSFYTDEANYNRTQRFKTGTDYLNRMREYNDAIKANYPGAKTVVAMDNTRKTNFNQDFKTTATNQPFWDAITFHRFVGDGPNMTLAMKHANNGLNGYTGFIQHYLDNTSPDTRIEIGEHSTDLAGILSLTHYNGIVIAENMLRMSKHPNIDHMQSWRIPLGLGYPRISNRDNVADAYQRDGEIDTNNYFYDFYDKAPSISARVVDAALNQSTLAWTTTVIGGATVETLVNTNPGTVPGTMPALYAQAYRGINGKNYVVIVNKSDKTHDVTIQMDSVNFVQTMEMTYVTANPSAKNNDDSQPVQLQTATVDAGVPVSIPRYSVTRLEWSRPEGPDAPPVPWLSYADARNNDLDTQWKHSENANIPAKGINPTTLTNNRNNKVDLKWQHSDNAAGYKIKYGTDPNNMKEIDVGNVTTFTVPALQSGSTYYFAVAAYNAAGMSAYSDTNPSNVVYVKISAPAAPKMTAAHYDLSGQADIEWESVPDSVGYVLKYGTTPGNYTNSIDAGNNVGKLVKGLTNDIPYYFVVSAYNDIGEGANSEEVTVTPSANVPLAPHDLSITNETATSISLKWLNTRANRETGYFENGDAGWNKVQGEWAVVDHPDSTRDTKVYKSSSIDTALTIFENASTGDLEGEARIVLNSYGTTSQAGVVARYTDKDNYYAFVYDYSDKNYKLIKRQNGVSTVLAKVSRKTPPTDFRPSIQVDGNQIILREDGDRVIDNPIVDATNPLTGGKFGLITVNQEAYFDQVLLRKSLGTVNVYRSNDPSKDFVLVASGLEGTTWTDSNLEADKTYYYRVTAIYMGNESYDHSNTILKD